MNYLQLCQRLAQESGTIKGDSLPTAVTGQSGRLLKIVNWVAAAWLDIQTAKDSWQWMRDEFSSGVIVAGTARYSPTTLGLTRHRRWLPDTPDYLSMSIYKTSDGAAYERPLKQISFPQFRSMYARGTHDQGTPAHWASAPDGELCLGPTPDAAYTISGEYWKSAQTLSANTDTPELPSDYHMLIVWRALINIAGFDEAKATLDYAKLKHDPLWNDLCRTQLPEISFGHGPLA